MVILDTNVIIDHLRQLSTKSRLRLLEEKVSPGSLGLSVITIQELYEGKSTREHSIQEILIEVVNSFKILPYTYEIAQLSGEMLRDENSQMGFADAAIAATAILNKASLFTLNKKDFQNIKNLELV